jgi:2-dehydropantoate 2-reductase
MKKRFLILGAGAIGSYLGGSLALIGHDIIFLEREKDIPALQRQGIILEIAGERKNIPSISFSHSLDHALAPKPDLIILAVKTYHLDTILPELIRVKQELPPLLCLQNGVESEKRLADVLGFNLVIPGTVTSAVDCPSKGHIIVRKLRGMGLAGNHPLVKNLADTFSGSGIDCKTYSDPRNMKWSKLISNLLGNASSAILNLTTAQIYANPALYQVEMDQIREALKVMDVQGIRTVNLPGVPVKILAGIIKYLPDWLSYPVLSRMIGGGRGAKMPSFHKDLHSGRGNSEVNQLNGAVVRSGEEYKIPTPVNSFLTETLLSLFEGKLPLDTYSQGQEKFLSEINSKKQLAQST